MKKNTIYIIIACILAIASPQLVSAADEDAYLGIGIGQANVEHNKSTVIANFPSLTASSSMTNSNYGFRLFGGGWFDQHLGLEIGVQDIPSFKATTNGLKTNLYSVLNISMFMLARKSIGEHEVFAKAGLSMWSVCTSSGCDNELESGQSLTYGLGANINIYDSANRVMRVEWEQVAIDSIYLKSLDVVSLNFVFKFNGGAN